MSILGTPKIEDIYKNKGRINSSELIYKFGNSKPIPWNKLFPSASEDALDLLNLMLQFDPDKRISAHDAIKHPYFNDFKEEDKVEDQADAVSKFDFEFEDMDLTTNELREMILYEIMLYHNEEILSKYEEERKQYLKQEKKNKLKTGSRIASKVGSKAVSKSGSKVESKNGSISSKSKI